MIVISVISVLLLIGMVLVADPRVIANELAQANHLLILAAIAVYALGQLFRIARWQFLLLAAEARVRWSSTFEQLAIGQALDDLTPLDVLGEASRIYGMHKEGGVPVGTALATIVRERLMDLAFLTLTLVAAITALFYTINQAAWGPLAFVVLLVILGNFVFIIILLRPDLIGRLSQWVAKWAKGKGYRWADGLEDRIAGLFMPFDAAMETSNSINWRLSFFAGIMTVLMWIAEFGRLYLIFLSLGAVATLPAIVVATVLSLAGQTFLPGGSGNLIVISAVFTAEGIALATAATAGVLSIATSIWLSVPIAVVIMFVTGLRVETKESNQR